jgi:hypothetical protein
MRANCEPEAAATTVRTEQQLKVSLDAPPQLNAPHAKPLLRPITFKSNTVARTDGANQHQELSTGSTGTYNNRGAHPDEKGEVNSLEFSDKWQRSDGPT